MPIEIALIYLLYQLLGVSSGIYGRECITIIWNLFLSPEIFIFGPSGPGKMVIITEARLIA